MNMLPGLLGGALLVLSFFLPWHIYASGQTVTGLQWAAMTVVNSPLHAKANNVLLPILTPLLGQPDHKEFAELKGAFLADEAEMNAFFVYLLLAFLGALVALMPGGCHSVGGFLSGLAVVKLRHGVILTAVEALMDPRYMKHPWTIASMVTSDSSIRVGAGMWALVAGSLLCLSCGLLFGEFQRLNERKMGRIAAAKKAAAKKSK